MEETVDHESPLGFLAVGVFRALLFGLKKGAITGYIKKTAFLQIGSVTRNKPDPVVKDARHYLKHVTKNTVLGMTVFGTYEYIAFNKRLIMVHETATAEDDTKLTRKQTISMLTTSIPIQESLHAIAAGSTPVFLHAIAGMCAGVAQSAVMLVWETVEPKHYRPHWNCAKRRAIHHSIGYASLFGTYEGVRRLLELGFYDILSKQETRAIEFIRVHPKAIDWMRREDGVFDITPLRWTFSFLAGGVAGHVYLVVSQALANKKKFFDLRKSIMSFRPTNSSFWITGLCFIAFEYGGELTERMLIEQKIQKRQTAAALL